MVGRNSPYNTKSDPFPSLVDTFFHRCDLLVLVSANETKHCSRGAFVYAYCWDEHVLEAHRPSFEIGSVNLDSESRARDSKAEEELKPTARGGIYFGHLGARIAAEVLDEGLNSDDLVGGQLSRYQKQWRGENG